MRRRRNSWLFEGKDEAGAEEVEFDDAGFDEEGDETVQALETLGVDVEELKSKLNDAEAEEVGDDDEFDLDMDDDLGDETYEAGLNESDDECDAHDETDDNDEVEINETMLRRALGASRRRRTARRRRVTETKRRRTASRRRPVSRKRPTSRRRRNLREGEAKAMAKSFGGGKLGKEMFVDVDENTLLNALAEELGGSMANSTSAKGSAKSKASDFGGGSIKKGAVMEARRHRRTKRVLAETKRKANVVARKARAAKAELKESNLFNAKLLFVTKLLQSHDLNNKQQRAIIEAMDNAKTQREAKLLFSSLNESLNTRTARKAATKNSTSRLQENRSRTGTTSKSLRSGQAARGNGVELDRWAVLAGLKK